MGIASEHKALAIIAAVAVLGVGVRLTRDHETVDDLIGTRAADAAVQQGSSQPRRTAPSQPSGGGSRGRRASKSAKQPPSTQVPVATAIAPLDRAGYVGDRLDLDGATLAQIESLPGIGPKLGARIVAYRAQHGPFLNKEGLRRVKGVGPSLLRKLDSLVTFSGRLSPLP